jgi:multiple antibiotic resistance protein
LPQKLAAEATAGYPDTREQYVLTGDTLEGFIGHALSVFMGFFAIMNPIANTPVFLGLTANDDAGTRRTVAAKALLVSAIIIVVFCAAGKLIFTLFGITLPAFRITGGILVAIVGFHMLQGGAHSTVQHPSDEDKKKSLDAALEVAITPLAMPILAGPGTIATAMNYASAGTLTEFAVTVSAFFVLCAITYAFFVFGERLVTYIGENGVKVITRLMGLILAVIGVQMLIHGVGDAVRAFSAG